MQNVPRLSNLDSNKAPRPDQILSYILIHCAQEIAPILKVIFTQSLCFSSLPKDWLMANILPIFKKGKVSCIVCTFVFRLKSFAMLHLHSAILKY